MSYFEEEMLHLIKQAFPNYRVTQQYSVVYAGQRLFFDFYIQALNILIECQGEQHYKFVPHFHGARSEFKESQRRDQLKREWAAQQGIPLLEISFNNQPEGPKEMFYLIHGVVFNE